MNWPARVIMLLLISQSTALAESPVSDDTPSLDFLEFLGEWETSDGEWVDPAMLESDEFDKVTVNGEAENEN